MVAGIALLPSLRLADRLGRRRGVPLALMSVVAVGVAWDAMLSLLAGQSIHVDLQALGSASGVPALAGGLYHAVILGLWAMAWMLVREKAAMHAGPLAVPGIEGIIFRDGRKTHVFEADEIDWIRADGDYVVIGAGKRRLMVRATLSGTESKLPATSYLRIHRSSIVRVQSIREVHPRPNNEVDVVLRDGTRLRASRRYSDRVLSAIGRRPTGSRRDGAQ